MNLNFLGFLSLSLTFAACSSDSPCCYETNKFHKLADNQWTEIVKNRTFILIDSSGTIDTIKFYQDSILNYYTKFSYMEPCEDYYSTCSSNREEKWICLVTQDLNYQLQYRRFFRIEKNYLYYGNYKLLPTIEVGIKTPQFDQEFMIGRFKSALFIDNPVKKFTQIDSLNSNVDSIVLEQQKGVKSIFFKNGFELRRLE